MQVPYRVPHADGYPRRWRPLAAEPSAMARMRLEISASPVLPPALKGSGSRGLLEDKGGPCAVAPGRAGSRLRHCDSRQASHEPELTRGRLGTVDTHRVWLPRVSPRLALLARLPMACARCCGGSGPTPPASLCSVPPIQSIADTGSQIRLSRPAIWYYRSPAAGRPKACPGSPGRGRWLNWFGLGILEDPQLQPSLPVLISHSKIPPPKLQATVPHLITKPPTMRIRKGETDARNGRNGASKVCHWWSSSRSYVPTIPIEQTRTSYGDGEFQASVGQLVGTRAAGVLCTRYLARAGCVGDTGRGRLVPGTRRAGTLPTSYLDRFGQNWLKTQTRVVVDELLERGSADCHCPGLCCRGVHRGNFVPGSGEVLALRP